MLNQDPKKSGALNKIFFLFITIFLIPILMIFLIEASVRVISPAHPISFFISEKLPDESKVLRANYLAAKRFFPANLARKPLPEIFSANKDSHQFRIFVLGESAARGEFLADFSFARMLQAVLQSNNLQIKVETINTGIPAINSWVINEIAGEIVDYQPDLVIIYAGHNEFIGPYGPASVFSGNAGRLAAKTGIFASSLHLIRKLKSDKLPENLQQGWQGLEMFASNRIEPDDMRIETCRANWRKNLSEMLGKLKSKAIPTIICSVPSNLRDCPPFMSKKLNPSNEELIEKLVQYYDEKDWQNLDQLFSQNQILLEKHALANWLWGQSKLHLGEAKLAKPIFKKARDLDCFKVRTTSGMNLTTGEVASSTGAYFIDLDPFFSQASKDEITGNELIYDHVHLTEKGHYIAAKAIFNKIKSSSANKNLALPDHFPTLVQTLDLMGYTNFDRIHNLKNILAATRSKPFNLLFNNRQRIEELSQELMKISTENDLTSSIHLCTKALETFPDSWMIAQRLALLYTQAGRFEEAVAYYNRALSKNPFNIDTLNNLGSLYLSARKLEKAEPLFRQALKLAPNFADAFFNLGLYYSQKNDQSAAIDNYQLALTIEPGFARALRNLGNIFFSQKKFKEAESCYRKAFASDPTDENSLLGQANSLDAMNQNEKAIELYKDSVAKFPESAASLYSLGLAYEKRGDFSIALDSYKEAMKKRFAPASQRALQILTNQQIEIPADKKLQISLLACEASNYSDPYNLQILAAIYTENALFAEARSTLHKALEIARQKNEIKLAQDLEESLKILAAAGQ